MKQRLALYAAVCLALLAWSTLLAEVQPDPPLVDPFRDWHTEDGKFLTNSRFAFEEDGRVFLWQQSGQMLPIPKAKLSSQDRKWLDDHPLSLIRGKVIFVADGDTIGVLDAERKTHRIRLEGIDSPESGQAFGKQSKLALNRALYGKEVRVAYEKSDTYGRILGHVYLDDTWINRQQIELGWAWHYRHFSGDAHLAKIHQQAQQSHVGLWKDKDPQAPWRFRLAEKKRKEAAQAASEKEEPMTATGYWLNTSSNVRHNADCKHFGKTSKGKYCSKEDGKPCGLCGG